MSKIALAVLFALFASPAYLAAAAAGGNDSNNNVSLKPAASEGMYYVSVIGSDSNDGLSWGSAKLTVQGALTALGANPGTITMGAGVFSLYSTIALTANGVILQGQGDASLNAIAATTLNWMGGASPIITTTNNRDIVLRDFNLENHGTATIGISIESITSDIFNLLVEHVSVTNPHTLFSDSAFKVSSPGNGPGGHAGSYIRFRNCFVALAAATGLSVDHANDVSVIDTIVMNNKNINIDVGPSNSNLTPAINFHMYGGSAEEDEFAGESSTAIGINLGGVYNSTIENVYFETQNAGEFAINVSSHTIGTTVANNFFNTPYTVTHYAINVVNGFFPVTIHDNVFNNYVMAGITSNAPTHLATYQNSAAGNTPIVISGGEGFPAKR